MADENHNYLTHLKNIDPAERDENNLGTRIPAAWNKKTIVSEGIGISNG